MEEISLDKVEKEQVKNYNEVDILICLRNDVLYVLRELHYKPIQNAIEIEKLNHALLLLEERLDYVKTKYTE